MRLPFLPLSPNWGRRIGSWLDEVPGLLGLAAPLIAGLTLSTVTTVTDTIILGPLGEIPLAVVSLTTSALSILFAALYGFMGPVAILAGHAHGARDPQKIAETLTHGLVLGALAGLAAGLLMVALMPFLWVLDQPPEVLAALPGYWLSLSATVVPFCAGLAFKQLYDAVDRPWLGVALALPIPLINVPLNYVLIYGLLGFPALGVTGAGIATFITMLAWLVLSALHWRFSKSMAPFRPVPASRHSNRADNPGDENDRTQISPWRMRWSVARPHISLGLPMGVQYLMEAGAFGIAGIMVGWFGATALAANQIVIAVSSITFMAPLGMAAAVSIRIAQASGEGSGAPLKGSALSGLDRRGPIGWAALAIVSVWMMIFAAIFWLWGAEIAALFVNEPAVIAQAGVLFAVIALMQLSDGIQSTSLGALRGLQDNTWPTAVSVLAYWFAALPACYMLGLPLGFGAAGVWAGFGVGISVAAVALTWRFGILTRAP